MIRFHLGPLLQGHMRTAKDKSSYNSLIIGPGSLQCETNLKENHELGIFWCFFLDRAYLQEDNVLAKSFCYGAVVAQ